MLAALGHRLGTVSLALLCPALAVVLGACGGASVQSSRDDSLCNGEYKEGWPGDYLELLLSDTNPNLCRADLRHANLSGRKLVGANLYEARLDEAHLEGAEMSGANLRRAILSSPGAIRDAQNRPRGPFLSGADLGGGGSH